MTRMSSIQQWNLSYVQADVSHTLDNSEQIDNSRSRPIGLLNKMTIVILFRQASLRSRFVQKFGIIIRDSSSDTWNYYKLQNHLPVESWLES